MKLPEAVYADGIVKGRQTRFGGLNHNPGAGDGELWDMENLTGDLYPLLAARRPRRLYRKLEDPGGLFSWDGPAWTDGTGFFYRGERKGTVRAGKKSFAALGTRIVIFPDKAWYDTADGTFGNLEAAWEGSSLTFTNGKLYGEAAEANTLQAAGVRWSDYFRAGDAVSISGCTAHLENNKTPVIREIDGDKLYFYENVFTLGGDKGTDPCTERGSLSVRRTVPDLDFLCENENRLWGCAGNTIYASKLGDPFNWNVFDGLSTDSYSADTGSAGKFTGCVSFLGYPVFFKEDHIYKVYGSQPSNFEIMGSATLGAAEGSGGSLAIAGETLFYLSRSGIMAYSGGIPQSVGGAFGLERHTGGAAGSDGLKYYISMAGEDGAYRLHVYDTRLGLWHTEDRTRALQFARWDGGLYFLNDLGEIWRADPPWGSSSGEDGGAGTGDGETREDPVIWRAEFGDFTEDSPNKKGVSKLQLRVELEEGAEVRALIRFDGTGEWIEAGGVLGEAGKRSYYLPIVPRRGDHYRLRLEGRGGCRVYSLTREYYSGSELKSRAGRQ